MKQRMLRRIWLYLGVLLLLGITGCSPAPAAEVAAPPPPEPTPPPEPVYLTITDSAAVNPEDTWICGGYEKKTDGESRIYMYVDNREASQNNLTLHIRRSNGKSYGTLTATPGTVASGYTEKNCPSGLYRVELNCKGSCVGSGYISFD